MRGGARWLTVTSVLLLGVACGDQASPIDARIPPARIDASCPGTSGAPRVLVYTRENLWNHGSNQVAAQTFLDMCASQGFAVTASADPRVFAERLSETDVVVFAVTSGPVLDPEAQAAFEPWVRAGGGVIGIHSASATELTWPFFIEMMGAQFRGHGPSTRSRLNLEHTEHPVLEGIGPATQERLDEWYTFWTRPEERGVTVLMSLDESTLGPDYPEELKVGYHALSWVHEPFGARVFYTALGHMPEIYAEPWFLGMLARAVAWTARRT